MKFNGNLLMSITTVKRFEAEKFGSINKFLASAVSEIYRGSKNSLCDPFMTLLT